ncbi:MAG: substrate-binding domain-containing protein [Kiritimatiellae bacterium]|nr:substrate-binding domain-containing protein [Kiritimatiellia bacterium]
MAPTIIYADCSLRSGIDRRRLGGLRRYAAARKWRVETLEHGDCSPAALREALARLHPIGCAAECWPPKTALRPAAFGRVPVVYFEPPDAPGWRHAHGMSCDNAAVGRLAFEELSSTRPPAYAVVSCGRGRRWANERTDSFLECCRKAGADCDVAQFPFESADEFDDCVGRMVPWVAALPHRCAVFAVNDLYALAAAKAMAAAGRSFPRSLTLIGADGDDPPPWDRELAQTISSVRLDFELGGYRAAKMLGERAGIVHKSPIANCPQVANGKSNSKIGTCWQSSQFPIENNPNVSIFPPLMVDRRKSTRGYGRREPRILEAVEMIRREACDGLTAANLAKRFPGTRQLFDLRFREAMGHSPLDEIIHVRMERVLELLAQPDFPISAIADFSGFPSERVLQKHFLARFHSSMREWRKARQG